MRSKSFIATSVVVGAGVLFGIWMMDEMKDMSRQVSPRGPASWGARVGASERGSGERGSGAVQGRPGAPVTGGVERSKELVSGE